LPKFTLVGATTRSGSLPTPLLSRFGIHLNLEMYDHEDLSMIVKRSANIMNIGITEGGAIQIATRSRGTPRIANRLLRRVHDFALVADLDVIDENIADLALTRLGIDKNGLDQLDRRYISWIKTNHHGGPVGVETIAAGLQETKETIEDRIEPYLIQAGYVSRTPRGRILNNIDLNNF
jgi:Holliday junction DNA helicase RuvB